MFIFFCRCPGVLETTIPKLTDSIAVLQSIWGTRKKRLEKVHLQFYFLKFEKQFKNSNYKSI